MKAFNFKKLSGLCAVVASLMVGSVNAADSKRVSRGPASMEEEVLTVPMSRSNFSNEVIFAEDDSGIMRSIKLTMVEWEKREEFVELWDLEGTGLYESPTTSDKKAYLGKRLLRYVDKRLSGEMKKAEEGSTLHAVSKVEKQLRPNAEVKMSENFGLKFRGRVLQGTAIVNVKNPWVDCNAVVRLNGDVKLLTKKDFKELGFTGGAEYSVSDSQLMAYIDRQITENVKARISSTQESGANVFGDDADARFELTASFPFNM